MKKYLNIFVLVSSLLSGCGILYEVKTGTVPSFAKKGLRPGETSGSARIYVGNKHFEIYSKDSDLYVAAYDIEFNTIKINGITIDHEQRCRGVHSELDKKNCLGNFKLITTVQNEVSPANAGTKKYLLKVSNRVAGDINIEYLAQEVGNKSRASSYYLNNDEIDIEKAANLQKTLFVSKGPRSLAVPFAKVIDLSPNGQFLINENLDIYNTTTGAKTKSIKINSLSKINTKSTGTDLEKFSIEKLNYLTDELIVFIKKSHRGESNLFVYNINKNTAVTSIEGAIDFSVALKTGEFVALQKTNEKRYRYYKYTPSNGVTQLSKLGYFDTEISMSLSSDGKKIAHIEYHREDLAIVRKLFEINIESGTKQIIELSKNDMSRPKFLDDQIIVCCGNIWKDFVYPDYISASGKWEVNIGGDKRRISNNNYVAVIKNSRTGQYKIIRFPYCIDEIYSIAISRDDKYLTLGAKRDQDCFQNYSDTSQPIWNIETGEELTTKDLHYRREKMKNNAAKLYKNYQEGKKIAEQERLNEINSRNYGSSNSYCGSSDTCFFVVSNERGRAKIKCTKGASYKIGQTFDICSSSNGKWDVCGAFGTWGRYPFTIAGNKACD